MSIYAVNGKTPIAAWIPSRDDAGNGTTTLNDLSGNGVNGSFVGLPTSAWTANTDAGGVRALNFTGANQYVDSATNATGLSFSLPITFSAWLRPRNLGTGKRGGIVNIGNSVAAQGEISLHINNSQAQLAIIGGGTFALGSSDLTNDDWYHIVGVFTAGGWSLFLNGTLDATRANGGTPTGDRILRIGRRSAVSQLLDGLLDDVRVWNDALTATDIAAMWRAGRGATNIKSIDLSVNGKAPIAAWVPSLDTPTSGLSGNGTTTLTDLVGSNNGTLTNMDPATDWVADTGAGGVRALDFDGVNDSVITGNLATSTANATITAWVKPNGAIGGNAGFITSRSDGLIGLVESFGAIDAVTASWNNTSAEWGNPGLSLNDNQWHFIALIVSGSTLTVYRDATFFTISITATSRTLGVFNLANDPGAGSRFFRGRIDDARIWSVALNATDVSDLYASGNGRGITFGGTIQTRRRRQLGGYGL